MSGEVAGPAVVAAGLVTFAGAAALAQARLLDDVVVAVVGVELIEQVAGWLAAAAVLVVAVVASRAKAGGGRVASGDAVVHARGRCDARQVRGPAQDGDGGHWSPADRMSIERHERRHERVADRLGVGGNWWIHDHGGSFQRNNDSHLSGVQRAAISYAGNGGSWWSHSRCDKQDAANARWYIENAYPRREWTDRHREARALARRLS